MLIKMIEALVMVLLAQFPKDKVKEALDALLDVIEDMVANSANQIDDTVVLPLCKAIREYFDIPDNDPVP